MLMVTRHAAAGTAQADIKWKTSQFDSPEAAHASLASLFHPAVVALGLLQA
jgi:hypothetical protein